MYRSRREPTTLTPAGTVYGTSEGATAVAFAATGAGDDAGAGAACGAGDLAATGFFLPFGLAPSTVNVGSCVSCARASLIAPSATADTPRSNSAALEPRPTSLRHSLLEVLDTTTSGACLHAPTLRNTMTQLPPNCTNGWLAGALRRCSSLAFERRHNEGAHSSRNDGASANYSFHTLIVNIMLQVGIAIVRDCCSADAGIRTGANCVRPSRQRPTQTP